MSSSSTDAATLVEVTMPQMGVSVSEGTIAEWHKAAGDQVAYEEPIVSISTDKIDTDVPSPAAGVVSEILVEVGETVEVGVVLARITTGGEGGQGVAGTTNEEVGTASEAAAAVGDTPAPSSDEPAPVEASSAAVDEGPKRARGGARYSPVVTRIAAEHGIDLSQVPGTGRGGRVRKQDVLAFIENGGGAAAAAEPAASEEPPLHIESPYRPDPEPARAPERPKFEPARAAAAGAYEPPAPQPLSRMRRTIGEHMKRSLDTAATCTTWAECDMSAVEAARKAGPQKLTALPFVARAAIDALREFPLLNAWLEGDRHTVHESVNLGIAVSLGEDGLIVPVIRDAQDLSVEGLAKRIRELARAARDRTLTPDDVQGATFTITNPGQYGSIMATPVINQPQVAILDLEAVVKRVVVVGEDQIAIRPMTILGLSWDHRALDGALAAQFLGAIRRRLEAAG
ncbi:MAG TPA: dihydrolipoamide acetyltransferase family protein [Solirubrobacteraceae bacterium]|nr:dihydrolipoamide acetyltransferase family protein [Solirubrobacteraceae bacterium]